MYHQNIILQWCHCLSNDQSDYDAPEWRQDNLRETEQCRRLSTKDHFPSIVQQITSEEDILNEAVNNYKSSFEPQKMAKDLKDIQVERELLCLKRLEMAMQNKSPPRSISDVTFVLKDVGSPYS